MFFIDILMLSYWKIERQKRRTSSFWSSDFNGSSVVLLLKHIHHQDSDCIVTKLNLKQPWEPNLEILWVLRIPCKRMPLEALDQKLITNLLFAFACACVAFACVAFCFCACSTGRKNVSTTWPTVHAGRPKGHTSLRHEFPFTSTIRLYYTATRTSTIKRNCVFGLRARQNRYLLASSRNKWIRKG
jgi:hypothetical protein